MMFLKKVEQAYPVLRMRERVRQPGMVSRLAELKNKSIFDDEANKAPYLKDTISFLQQKGGNVSKRLLIVSENEVAALKAAAYMKDHMKEFQVEMDGLEFFLYELDEDDMEEDNSGCMKVISLHRGRFRRSQG